MKHLKPYKLFEKVESEIPQEDYDQIMDIFISSFDGSPVSFTEDDITEVDNISNYNRPSLVQVQYGYKAICICVSFPIPHGLAWAYKKSYRKLEKKMKPYLDRFESLLNSYGYLLRRDPMCPLKTNHYDFEFYVSRTDNGGLHFRDMEFAKDALKLIRPDGVEQMFK